MWASHDSVAYGLQVVCGEVRCWNGGSRNVTSERRGESVRRSEGSADSTSHRTDRYHRITSDLLIQHLSNARIVSTAVSTRALTSTHRHASVCSSRSLPALLGLHDCPPVQCPLLALYFTPAPPSRPPRATRTVHTAPFFLLARPPYFILPYLIHQSR